MRLVEPKVFLIGETRIITKGLKDYLKHIGLPRWKSKDWRTGFPSDIEKIIEVYGRICYKSWKPGLNPNVTKVRDTNRDYLENIITSEHGSVLEHGYINFVFADVSRVFTHELVRHRVGDSFSQESLRYVRLTDLSFWPSPTIIENEKLMEIYVKTFEELERLQRELARITNIDSDSKKSFHIKKRLTSAFRRLAPIGLATTIGWGANIRTLRHVIQFRTDPAAEEEIRFVFGKVAEVIFERYPNLFFDFRKEIVDGLPCYRSNYAKI